MSHRSHKSRRDRDRHERDKYEDELSELDWREDRDEALARNGFAINASGEEAVSGVLGFDPEAVIRDQEAALKAARERAQTAELALANRVHRWTFRLWVAGGVVLGGLGGYIIRLVTE